MYPSVIKVTPRKDFTLDLEFDNGDEGVLDMKSYLDFGAFRKIKEYDRFKQVNISFDTIEWDCGVDLDPEFIYENCRKRAKA